MPLRTLGLIVLILAATAVTLRADPSAAEFRNGHWQPIAPPTAAPPPVDPDLDHMQQLLDVGDAKAALNVGLIWVKSHSKTAPLRDRTLYLIAQAKYRIDGSDDRVNAYYYCDELMEEYPASKWFFPALELQFKIADEYLDGHKGKFLGFAFVSLQDEAVEMLYRIQQRSPGSPLAEKALLRTCDFYYSVGEYELAHDAYGFYAKTYPRSPMLAQVMLRRAFSSLAQFRGVRFDPTCMIDARAELSDVIAAYPPLAKEENLKSIVHRIDEALARKLLVTADYYRRTDAAKGAVYVYRYLIDTYPASPDADKAKKMLATMSKSALSDPPPKVGNSFMLPAAPDRGT